MSIENLIKYDLPWANLNVHSISQKSPPISSILLRFNANTPQTILPSVNFTVVTAYNITTPVIGSDMKINSPGVIGIVTSGIYAVSYCVTWPTINNLNYNLRSFVNISGGIANNNIALSQFFGTQPGGSTTTYQSGSDVVYLTAGATLKLQVSQTNTPNLVSLNIGDTGDANFKTYFQVIKLL